MRSTAQLSFASDCETTIASFDLDQELKALFSGFVERLKSRRDALILVLSRGDTASALRLLHQLEGSSAMYGLAAVSRRAAEISQAIERSDSRFALTLAKSLCDPELVGMS